MSKHTPGPWETGGRLGSFYNVWNPLDEYGFSLKIAKVFVGEDDPRYPAADEAEANARLIEAAPEMYRALEEVENLLGELLAESYLPESWEARVAVTLANTVEKALAKARGEKS